MIQEMFACDKIRDMDWVRSVSWLTLNGHRAVRERAGASQCDGLVSPGV